MVQYTSYFTLSQILQEEGYKAPTPVLKEEKEYSEEDLRAELERILEPICTLEDYKKLIDIISEMREQITLMFLYVFFLALASVEERVWASVGMKPPVRQFIEENIDLLLDQYLQYAYNLEKSIIDWAKETGNFEDPTKYEFMLERNKIYGEYVTLAGEIIGDDMG